jgi:hypothetical protein
MDLANVHAARIGDGLELVDGKVAELPLNGLQVLEDTIGVMTGGIWLS